MLGPRSPELYSSGVMRAQSVALEAYEYRLSYN